MVNNRIKKIRENLCNLWCKKRNHKSEIINGKQRNLEQDPEHRDHRTYRHRHHLRSDFMHGRVNERKGYTFWSVSLFLLGYITLILLSK